MEIDLRAAIGATETLLTELRRLDGIEPDEAPTRVARRQRMELNRDLLHAAHLCERARIEVMEAYWGYKQHADPAVERGADE